MAAAVLKLARKPAILAKERISESPLFAPPPCGNFPAAALLFLIARFIFAPLSLVSALFIVAPLFLIARLMTPG
jgi:hypothetical protein